MFIIARLAMEQACPGEPGYTASPLASYLYPCYHHAMKTVRVYRLHPSPHLFQRLKAAQMEAAQVWNLCMETHKQARMAHGKSSQCPVCGHRHKPKGRTWACRACGFTGHRDLVGSVNMHRLAYSTHLKFPRSFTYLRPGWSRSRSRRADTPQRCLSESSGSPLLVEQVPLGTGYTADAAQKPICL